MIYIWKIMKLEKKMANLSTLAFRKFQQTLQGATWGHKKSWTRLKLNNNEEIISLFTH